MANACSVEQAFEDAKGYPSWIGLAPVSDRRFRFGRIGRIGRDNGFWRGFRFRVLGFGRLHTTVKPIIDQTVSGSEFWGS
ncbi:hypothetical protein [Primorskyibacter sp. S87]|uniref:hypothetical protein n=1 Tax=Primorskyibacter sp. S87 TaxID=3415126 RepID=UPI003C7D7FEB